MALYLLSPYINHLINTLEQKQLRKMFITVFVICSIQPYAVDIIEYIVKHEANGLSFIGLKGDMAGYSLVNFVLLYTIGALLRKTEKNNYWSQSILYYIIGSTVLSVALLYSCLVSNIPFLLNYNSPIVIADSVFIFIAFKRINMRNSRAINYMAKSSFTVYLVHNYVLRIIKYLLEGKGLLLGNSLIIESIIGVIVTYSISVLIWCVLDKPLRIIGNR